MAGKCERAAGPAFPKIPATPDLQTRFWTFWYFFSPLSCLLLNYAGKLGWFCLSLYLKLKPPGFAGENGQRVKLSLIQTGQMSWDFFNNLSP